MKLALVCLFVVFAAVTSQRIRLPLPYEARVKTGGLPLPLSLRDKHPMWAYDFETPENRIAGGRDAANGEVPFQISLRTTSHSCGGIIINSRTIVTSAHCVDGISVTSLSIRYNTLTHGSGGTIVSLDRYVIHENYNSATISSDIALLITSTALTLGQPQADAVTLPAQGSDPAAGTTVDVAGWGTTSEGGSLAATLKVVGVPIVDRATCDAKYGGGLVDNTMICAGVDQGGLGECQGDSGGPLYDASKTLLGVVSWGIGCARPNYPGVYARVGLFVDWIRANQQS